MDNVGRYAHCTKGCWTVTILTDGSLHLKSCYQGDRINYSFRLFNGNNVSGKFPKYLYNLVQEAWEVMG